MLIAWDYVITCLDDVVKWNHMLMIWLKIGNVNVDIFSFPYGMIGGIELPMVCLLLWKWVSYYGNESIVIEMRKWV